MDRISNETAVLLSKFTQAVGFATGALEVILIEARDYQKPGIEQAIKQLREVDLMALLQSQKDKNG